MIESEIDRTLCFIDSNIWLYAFINFQDADKSVSARSAIRNNDIAISTQVITHLFHIYEPMLNITIFWGTLKK